MSFGDSDCSGFSRKLFYYSGFVLVFFLFFTFWWIFNLLSLSISFNRFEYFAAFFVCLFYFVFSIIFKI